MASDMTLVDYKGDVYGYLRSFHHRDGSVHFVIQRIDNNGPTEEELEEAYAQEEWNNL